MTPSLQLRSIELRVRDLARSVDFYARQLGFVVLEQSSGRAVLATAPGSPGLLVLTENRAAKTPPADAAGLFHAALLLPQRAALGRWLRAAADARVEFDGFSDHGVSEAIYLVDPEGNGLEFYVDRPRDQWPHSADGTLAMGTEPLALPALLAAGAAAAASAATDEPRLAGARWGHLHLKVTDLDRAQKFYESALGVSLMQRYGSSARFLAADGYHHHLGLNTWSRPHRPQPPDALGLVEAVFAEKGATSDTLVRDPDGIAVRVAPLASAGA